MYSQSNHNLTTLKAGVTRADQSDVFKWKRLPNSWPFMRRIHRSRRAIIRSFDGDLRRHGAHVTSLQWHLSQTPINLAIWDVTVLHTIVSCGCSRSPFSYWKCAISFQFGVPLAIGEIEAMGYSHLSNTMHHDLYSLPPGLRLYTVISKSPNIMREFGQYHECWCPCSLRRDVISSHGHSWGINRLFLAFHEDGFQQTFLKMIKHLKD